MREIGKAILEFAQAPGGDGRAGVDCLSGNPDAWRPLRAVGAADRCE